MLRGSWAYLDESMIDVEPHVPANIRPEGLEAGRRRIASLDRFTKDPQLRARLTLRRDSSAQPPYADEPKATLTAIAGAGDGHGKVIYLRVDEDYGPVEPAP